MGVWIASSKDNTKTVQMHTELEQVNSKQKRKRKNIGRLLREEGHGKFAIGKDKNDPKRKLFGKNSKGRFDIFKRNQAEMLMKK